MQRFRMFKQDSSSDCTVTLVGDEGSSTYPAHVSVLAKASKMFAAKLGDWSDPCSPKLEVTTTTLSVAEELLRFAYFGRLSKDFPNKDILLLIVDADRYAFPSLVEACVRRLVNVVETFGHTLRLQLHWLPDSLVSSHLCVEANIPTVRYMSEPRQYRAAGARRSWMVSLAR